MPETQLANDYFVVAEKNESKPQSLSFGELHERYASLVHAVVLARVPFDEVEDIKQEVFISAFKSLDSVRDKDAMGPWLATIARNKTVEYYRKRKPTEELFEHSATSQGFEAQANEAITAIKSLPDAYRETLILRLVEGLTGPEISKLTGKTEASVRVNLHRGMKKLRKKLGMEKSNE